MICSECGRQIADDSIFCSYCAAAQQRPTQESGTSEAVVKNEDAAHSNEPSYTRTFLDKLIGRVVTIALLAALIGIVYLISSSGEPLFMGWITAME